MRNIGWRKILKWSVLGLLVVVLLIQVVPYGRDHTNPPVTAEAPWPSAETRTIAVQACYDCHSNQTNWRWYSFVAPVSWLVRSHVGEGRRILNFTEWDRGQRTDEMVEVVERGSMPPLYYRIMHSGARLSQQEKDTLVAALQSLPAPG
jgi:hypothetical protein